PPPPPPAAALAALALTACGAEKTDADGSQGALADTAGSPSGVAFTEMLNTVAQQCPPNAPAQTPSSGPAQRPSSGPAQTLRSGPAQTLPSGPAQRPSSGETPPPGETPPSDAIEPMVPTAGPEVELNARDWCASNLHEERIAHALWDLADPTPTEVRKILNDLGYIDERIHDLKQSGAATHFFLDLRDQGGRLCLDGSAAGEQTVVDKCVAPATGPFAPGERKV
ncbi:hypothetical protein, partial [Streptomyces sp. SAS_272]|uniref:hypothetical protein n=1 Tax=Streptomyces sp. SAS_272 TaxID=3412747 RepID=UPI00403CF319